MNTDVIIVAVIAAIPGLISAVRGWKNPSKLEKIHLDLNSRVDELVLASKAQSRAEGVEQERGDERKRIRAEAGPNQLVPLTDAVLSIPDKKKRAPRKKAKTTK